MTSFRFRAGPRDFTSMKLDRAFDDLMAQVEVIAEDPATQVAALRELHHKIGGLVMTLDAVLPAMFQAVETHDAERAEAAK
jgi:hypothetical protein